MAAASSRANSVRRTSASGVSTEAGAGSITLATE